MTEPRTLAPHGDMASCVSDTCPQFGICWRAQKPASGWRQSYTWFHTSAEQCREFIPIKELTDE